ncbi:hypothetical protein DRQ21_07010 [Candidatus Fermentibacteria bacterium]|nr:MAG: hypothetical protein DRQ21_07010 [Candidatus Fermentibacteria bacterium]
MEETMAENSTGLTTEQLLMELGKVVLGLGRKIEVLGEKMDAIHSVLADDIAPSLKADENKPAGEAAAADLTPLLEKLDELKAVLEKESSEATPEDSGTSDVLAEKLQAIETVLSSEILPSIKEAGGKETSSEIDLTPVIEKIDAVSAAMGKTVAMDELKPLIENLSASFEKLPSEMSDSLKKLKESDSSNPMETVEKKLTEVYNKLEEILKTSSDRKYVDTITTGMTEVKEQLASSGVQVLEVVKAVPEKIDKMGGDLSEAIKVLSENTGAMLDKTEKNISESGKSLESIKEELEKGLKMNTDMTSQMVDLTAKFVDRAEEDRITDLNTRAIGHFNRGEYTESEALFSQALNLAPENPELLCNTAHLKAAMEEMEEAEQLFRKALEITPDLEPAVSGLGLLMVKTDRAEETIEFLKNAIPETDMSVRTVIALSRALAAVGKHAEAVELLETSLRGAPEHPDLKQELAGYGQEEKS